MAFHPSTLALAFFAAVLPAYGQSGRLGNLSVRTTVPPAGASVFFTVTGAAPKTVLLRAVGPGLAAFGIAGAVSDSQLTVTNSAGATVASNDNWETDAAVAATSTRVGAFSLARGSLDAATVASFSPGTYTVTARGAGGSVGALLLEVYDADNGLPLSVFSTLSFRGPTGPNSDVLFAGAVVTGGTAPLLVRALGPALTRTGVSDAIADPKLILYGSNGALLGQNDDWNNDTIIAGLASQAGAYSAVVRGAYGGTGEALIEVYEVR